MSQFQLFPPATPEVKFSNNPFRKPARKPATKAAEPGSPIPLKEIQDSTRTESVLLKIIEDTHKIPPPPPVAHLARSKFFSGSEASQTPPSARGQSRQGTASSSQGASSLQGSASNSSSSVRSATSATSPQSSQSSVSPVPMRSMFPRFNPKVPVDKQEYRPQIPGNASMAKPPRPQLTITPVSEIDQALGPKTVPASVVNFPTGNLEPDEPRYSSPEELELLWEAANGQRPEDLVGTFNLCMARTGPATFTFGPSPQPLYTLQTYSNDELSISRGLPSKPNTDVPIMTLSLEDRLRREHPNDGLVAHLFSRLAAMLAIEQAGEISTQHHLSPADAADVESDALKRAAAQESCRLSWNRNLRLYELRHPSLSRRHPPALVGAAGIPLSPVRSQSFGILHISVSAPSSNVMSPQPPTIIVTGPVSSTAMEAAQQAATSRTSTLPVTDSDEPLASLDFGTRTLSISPAAVIATIPSLYAIDSLIAAMLAVAVSDEATNNILADMTLDPSHPAHTNVGPDMASIPFRGKLITTLAEQEDYEESMELASQIESANAKSKSAAKKRSLFRFWNRKRSNSQGNRRRSKKNKEIVVEEFDLEKYGRYGSTSSRKGEKLPGITRSLLRILFFALDVLVKALTMFAKVLAWLLVNMTRCVTSEKF